VLAFNPAWLPDAPSTTPADTDPHSRLPSPGVAVIKPNYRQQKKQKELARKTRQAQKQKRRAERTVPEAAAAGDTNLPEKSAS